MFWLKSMRLAEAEAWRRPFIILATGFGLGLVPVASGTAGSLPGLAILWGLAAIWQGPVIWQILLAGMLGLLAIPLCGLAERHFGQKDDARIVADEYLTFPLCMIGLPLVPWMLAVAFLTNRLFDVLKPPPARNFQAWPGGLGIVVDDAISALYSLAVNHAFYQLIKHLYF
ncbi:MAG: phosphatidylglycerophosphatase A [Lentisphaerae bacterium]|nr:phosphatidylglycerophosphatase A [Lentisphaerota bacterium]